MTTRSVIGRPRGQEREALLAAAQRLAEAQGPATWRELAEAACVGYATAKTKTRDMARAGELVAIDQVATPHNNRPMTRFAPRGTGFAQSATGFGPIVNAMKSWRA